ncbi:Gremlin 2, DAN BMP antagonist [Branchiostoma belcheri]|nr:Gremlin 2, DAN BMP antagonist [Branchiostoma belcheri]
MCEYHGLLLSRYRRVLSLPRYDKWLRNGPSVPGASPAELYRRHDRSEPTISDEAGEPAYIHRQTFQDVRTVPDGAITGPDEVNFPRNLHTSPPAKGDLRRPLGQVIKYLSDCTWVMSGLLVFSSLPLQEQKQLRISAEQCSHKKYRRVDLTWIQPRQIRCVEFVAKLPPRYGLLSCLCGGISPVVQQVVDQRSWRSIRQSGDVVTRVTDLEKVCHGGKLANLDKREGRERAAAQSNGLFEALCVRHTSESVILMRNPVIVTDRDSTPQVRSARTPANSPAYVPNTPGDGTRSQGLITVSARLYATQQRARPPTAAETFFDDGRRELDFTTAVVLRNVRPTRHPEYRSVLDRLRYTISSSLGDTDSSFGAEELLHRFQTLGITDGEEQALADEAGTQTEETTRMPNDESDNRLPGDDDVIKTALGLFSEAELPQEVEGSAHASSEHEQVSPVDDRYERKRFRGRKSRRNRRRKKHNKRDKGQRRSEKKSIKVRIGQSALYAVGSVVRLPLRKRDLRKDWCKAVAFDQEVSAPGCETKLVRNKFCYGQCSSFHIPRQHPGPFDSCASCTPTRTRSEKVVLNCQGNETRVRKVSIVEECACRPDTVTYPREWPGEANFRLMDGGGPADVVCVLPAAQVSEFHLEQPQEPGCRTGAWVRDHAPARSPGSEITVNLGGNHSLRHCHNQTLGTPAQYGVNSNFRRDWEGRHHSPLRFPAERSTDYKAESGERALITLCRRHNAWIRSLIHHHGDRDDAWWVQDLPKSAGKTRFGDSFQELDGIPYKVTGFQGPRHSNWGGGKITLRYQVTDPLGAWRSCSLLTRVSAAITASRGDMTAGRDGRLGPTTIRMSPMTIRHGSRNVG